MKMRKYMIEIGKQILKINLIMIVSELKTIIQID